MDVVLLPDEKIEELLIGDFKIIQSENLYRFTSDAVLLSRFATLGAKSVLDICSGSGIVGFHYYALSTDCGLSPQNLSFVEVQKQLADMCLKSVMLNNLCDSVCVHNSNLCDFNGENSFDLVLCNPPYKKAGSGYLSRDEHISICRAEVLCTFDDIAKCASKALKCGGKFCFCHKPERLTDVILSLTSHGLFPSRLQYVCGKTKTEPYLFLMEAVKDKKLQLKTDGFAFNVATDFKG